MKVPPTANLHPAMMTKLPDGAFDKATLQNKMLLYRPMILAFTSKTAGRAFCGNGADLGWQDSSIGDTRVHILPSTSPSARWQ
jgi:TDG/mug DNA glycosylase family protein